MKLSSAKAHIELHEAIVETAKADTNVFLSFVIKIPPFFA
jgi:hypothetical protein